MVFSNTWHEISVNVVWSLCQCVINTWRRMWLAVDSAVDKTDSRYIMCSVVITTLSFFSTAGYFVWKDHKCDTRVWKRLVILPVYVHTIYVQKEEIASYTPSSHSAVYSSPDDWGEWFYRWLHRGTAWSRTHPPAQLNYLRCLLPSCWWVSQKWR